MIEHLKKIHQALYVPSIDVIPESDIDVTSIPGPYLFTQKKNDSEIHSVNAEVTIPIWNIGNQPLRIHSIDFQGTAKSWLSLAKLTQVIAPNTEETITCTFDLQRYLNRQSESTNQIHIYSNSTTDLFSTISIHVNLPENPYPKLKLPEFVNFGEIPVWKLSLTVGGDALDKREFYLVLNSTKNAPGHLQLTKGKKKNLKAILKVKNRHLYYDLSLDKSGFVLPQTKSDKYAKLSVTTHTFPVENLSNADFTGTAYSNVDWLSPSLPQKITAGTKKKISLSADVTKMQFGRNFGRLDFQSQSGQPLNHGTVWVSSVVTLMGESTFTLEGAEQEKINHNQSFPGLPPKLPIKVIPKQLKNHNFPLFEDVSFHFPYNESRQVFLVGDFNDWRAQQLLLEKRESDLVTTLSLPDSTYFYRYEADGEMRLDPQHLDECFICPHGFASRRTISRCECILKVRVDKKSGFIVHIFTDVPWLEVSPEQLEVQNNRQNTVTVRLDAKQLEPGLNYALIRFESPDFLGHVYNLPISIIAQPYGIVPRIEKIEHDLGSLETPNVSEQLVMKVIGQGELKGKLIPEKTTSLIQKPSEKLATGGFYRVEDGNLILKKTNPFISLGITLDMEINLSNNQPIGDAQIYLVTNCYLSNRRVYKLNFHYSKPHLIVSPPALHFPNVFLGDSPKSCDIAVSYQDSKEIALEVQPPKALKQLLTLEKVSGNRCQLILNPQVLQKAGVFSDVLSVHDRKSGLSEHVPVFIRVIDSTAKISVTQLHSDVVDALELKIANNGANALKIFNLNFVEQRFYCVPRFIPNTILRPNETKRFLLKTVLNGNFLTSLTVSDTLTLSLSDRRYLHFQQPIQLKILSTCTQFFKSKWLRTGSQTK